MHACAGGLAAYGQPGARTGAQNGPWLMRQGGAGWLLDALPATADFAQKPVQPGHGSSTG